MYKEAAASVKVTARMEHCTAEDKNETANTLTGTVNGIGLRIRKGAGTNYAIVGTLTIGDKVTILETKTVSGMKWGRITKGWISLDYVTLN